MISFFNRLAAALKIDKQSDQNKGIPYFRPELPSAGLARRRAAAPTAELVRLVAAEIETAALAHRDHRADDQTAFQQHVGRWLSEAIDRQRIEHAKVLVRETRHKLHESGFFVGFFR